MTATSKSKALITGASSGIGAAFADALANQGYDLVLVARRADRLEQKAISLKSKHGTQCELLVADLVDPEDLQKVEDRLEHKNDITMLVNNAGIGDIAPFADQSRQVHSRMIALNVEALTRLAHAAVQPMRTNGRGAIINVASGFAFDYMPGASVYAASKAYVAQLTHVLDQELSSEGLRFQALIPGLTRTELGGAEESGFFDTFPAELVMSPKVVAQASLVALDLNETVCFPRLEDYSRWQSAHEAIRGVGKSPDHNHLASRYLRDIKS